MSIQQMTPPQAHEAMQASPEALFLDVRSQGEFAAGHPAGAINIPIVFFDEASGTRSPNGDFVAIVDALIADKHRPIFLSCLAGGRSQSAAEVLAQVGYSNLTNIQGGWGGGGGVPGWQAAGLPTSQDTGEGVGFASLQAKTNA
jgi:rhodanese-related sulfurtransferase